MRSVMIDDDGSEWPIEILDGDRVIAAPTKSVKQTPSTSTHTGSKPTSKEVHPLLLTDFSTKVAVPESKSTGQKTTKRALDSQRILPCKLTGQSRYHASHSTDTKETRQFGPHPAVPALEMTREIKSSMPHKPPNSAPPNNHHQKQGASSSSSTQNSARSEANEEELLLPVYSFTEYKNAPVVVYTKSESEANELVQTLRGPLGFDLEWRVMWHRGAQERRTALVQLCDHHTILLIQVSNMKRFPRNVLEVIESADVVKTGANILNDGQKLFRDFGIQAKGLVELGALAAKADVQFSSVYNREIVGLAKMVAMYLGRTLLKGKVRTSNWEAGLSHKMVEYAANDCHCALMVYNRLQETAARAGKTLDMSTYSCQVNPRAFKTNVASPPTLTQRLNAPAKPPVPDYCIPEPPRPQQLRAYNLWHVDKMSLDQMCTTLRTGARVEPLKESTIISYVVGALQADPQLPFDMDQLKALVLMEAGSWQRHRQWITSRV